MLGLLLACRLGLLCFVLSGLLFWYVDFLGVCSSDLWLSFNDWLYPYNFLHNLYGSLRRCWFLLFNRSAARWICSTNRLSFWWLWYWFYHNLLFLLWFRLDYLRGLLLRVTNQRRSNFRRLFRTARTECWFWRLLRWFFRCGLDLNFFRFSRCCYRLFWSEGPRYYRTSGNLRAGRLSRRFLLLG